MYNLKYDMLLHINYDACCENFSYVIYLPRGIIYYVAVCQELFSVIL